MLDVDAVLEANRNLSRKISELEKQVEENWGWKERYIMLERNYKRLQEAYDQKLNVLLQIDDYIILIDQIHQTSDGIRVITSSKNIPFGLKKEKVDG